MWGYKVGDPKADLSFDERDNAKFAPLAAVLDEAFTWGDDRPPQIPWHKTLIYELHVKGFTKLHPDVPEKLRGTYAGLGSDAAIRYLKSLGVTAVELLPVHEHRRRSAPGRKEAGELLGLQHARLFRPAAAVTPRSTGAGDVVREFKTMVRNLHAAGIEVILDVVYNHTAEGNQLGPTLSFRGIDNASYYRLSPEDPRYYMDFTGCGNTFNMRNPRVLQLIMDSLRYWITHMHIDGFRFDLASTLARELHEVDKLGAFFDIIHQDPIISQVKLIAEPWDLGDGRLPGGQLSGVVVGMERQISRLHPPVLERGRRHGVGICHAVLRFERSVRMEQPPAARQHQLHHLPTTVSRCTIWSPTTRSTTKPTAKTIATAPTTISVGTAAPKGPPTIQRSSNCAKGKSAACWPRCSCRKARPCCWPATKWATRKTATTTPIARTTKSPGSTGI